MLGVCETRSVDSYVEEVTPVVNKEKRKMRRLTMVAGVGAAVLGAIALSAVTFTDSSNTRAFLPQARLLQVCKAASSEDQRDRITTKKNETTPTYVLIQWSQSPDSTQPMTLNRAISSAVSNGQPIF